MVGVFFKNPEFLKSPKNELTEVLKSTLNFSVECPGLLLGIHKQYHNSEINTKEHIYANYKEGIFIIAELRIDYREELIEALGESHSNLSGANDIQLLFFAYKKWGKNLLEYIYGDFAFAIWDERVKELFCARDPFGCRPFFYSDNEDFFIFSSNIGVIINSNFIPILVDDLKMAECALSIFPEKDKTLLKNISRLVPAHSLVVSKANLHIKKYWELAYNSIHLIGNELEAKNRLFDLLTASINERIRSNDSVSTELSGGLDSSVIAAVTSEIRKKRNIEIEAFSHGMSPEQNDQDFAVKDETYYSKLVVKHLKLDRHFIVTGGDIGAYDLLIKHLTHLPYPDIQIYGIFSDGLLSQVKEAGGEILLSGVGGDQMVSSNVRGFHVDLINRKQWALLHDEISSKRRKRFNSASISRMIVIILRIFPWSFNVVRGISIRKYVRLNCRYNSNALLRVFKKQVGGRKFFRLNRFEPILGTVRDQQKLELSNKGLVSRLESSYLAGQQFGIDYRYPLLDKKLIEYYFNLPSELKYRSGIGRYILRKSIENYLPERISWRMDKVGVTIPNLTNWIIQDIGKFRDLIDQCRESLHYHYFDYGKLLKMASEIEKSVKGKMTCFGPKVFIFAMQILILQKWQREGRINIGIKC